MKNRLTKTHASIFAVMLVIFTILTFLITNEGVDHDSEHNTRVFFTTLGTITGPLTGAISRGFQSCCLRFSLTVMAYCALPLLLGVGLQFLHPGERKWLRVVRMSAWIVGWLAWFLGGIFSFLHALS